MENQILLLSGLSTIVCELTNEQAGELFKCILAKAEDVELDIEDQAVKIAFNAIELLMEQI